MKPELAILTAHDRLATWTRFGARRSDTPDRVLELAIRKERTVKLIPSWGASIRYPAEEFEFFAYLSEMQGSAVN